MAETATQFGPPPGLLQSVIVTISAAQLKANMLIPGIVIIPPPGAGKIVYPLFICMQLKAGGTPFNFVTVPNIADYQSPGVNQNFGAWSSPAANTFYNSAVDALDYASVPQNGGNSRDFAKSLLENAGYNLFGPTNATLGTGSLIVTAFYVVVSMQ
jgi:hypothetical protein